MELDYWPEDMNPILIWFGKSFDVYSYSVAIFKREQLSNLLVVGNQAQPRIGILSGLMLSLYVTNNKSVQIYIVNKSGHIGKVLSDIASDMSKNDFRVQYSEESSILGSYCDDLINLLEERKQMTDRQLAHERSVFLIVAESQSFRSLIKPVSDDFIQNLSDTATKLLSLIKEGSLYGIFVVISSASLQNWKSIFELSTIEYFKHRCLLPMNQASSYEFISS